MTVNIKDVLVPDMYAENGNLCYSGSNIFKTTVGKTYYNNEINREECHEDNFVVSMCICKKYTKTEKDATSIDKLIQFMKYVSEKFNETTYPSEFAYVNIDMLKLKIYVDDVEINILNSSEDIISRLVGFINKTEIELTFELIIDQSNKMYIPFVSEMRIIDPYYLKPDIMADLVYKRISELNHRRDVKYLF